MRRLRVPDKSLLALGLLAAAALLRWPLSRLLACLMPSAAEVPSVFYGALILQELLLYALPAAVLLRRVSPRRQEASAARPGWLVYALCALLGAAAQYLLQGVTWLWMQLLDFLPAGVSQGQVMMPRNFFEGLLAFCALALVPALVEETLFRGAVYPCLCRDFSQRAAFWLTVGTFTLMHGSLTGLPAHLGVGWMTTALRARRGRLGASIAFHLAYNGMGLMYSLLPTLHVWERIPWEVLVGVSLALFAGLAVWMAAVGRGLDREPASAGNRAARLSAGGLTLLLALGYLPELLASLGL